MGEALNNEQRDMIEEHYGFVIHKAKKWRKRIYKTIEWDDIVGLCELGICKAALNYDPERGAKFITYASHVIDNEVRMDLRKRNRKYKKKQPLASFKFEDGEGTTYFTKEFLDKWSVDDSSDPIVLWITARKFANELEGRDLRLLWYRYKGYTQKDIAQFVGVSQSYISRLLKDIKKRLLQELHRKEE